MALPLRSPCRIHAAEVRVALHSHPRHMLQGRAQAGVPPAPHHHLAALATLLGDGGDPTMRTPHLRVPFSQGLGRFRKEPGRPFTPDSRQRQPHRHLRCPPPCTRRLSQRVQEGAPLVVTGLQWRGPYPQARQQELTMGLSGFGRARGHR